MNGDWEFGKTDDELPRFARAVLDFTDGTRLIFVDSRALGTIELHNADTALDLGLGPDAAAQMVRGPSIEKSIAPLRSYVFEPMRHGSLLLCGDAAHIVPPTGAKGLNLAASDVHYAAQALTGFFKASDHDAIAGYSAKALARVWKSERFSWSLTKLMHRFPDDGPFERAMQVAELEYISTSRAAQTSIAENYVGLPV